MLIITNVVFFFKNYIFIILFDRWYKTLEANFDTSLYHTS